MNTNSATLNKENDERFKALETSFNKEKLSLYKTIESWEQKYFEQEKNSKATIDSQNTLLKEKAKELRDLYEENIKQKLAIKRLTSVLSDTNKNINSFVFVLNSDGDEVEISKTAAEWEKWSLSLNAEFDN